VTEKADRATSEQVLDPRTRMVLFKMLNRGIIKELNGCISTGKEVLLSLNLCLIFCRLMFIILQQIPEKKGPSKYTRLLFWYLRIEINMSVENFDSEEDIANIIPEKW
jgi:hypothetical protein